MGKRKSSKKPQTTKKGPAPLDTTFRCLFCQHPGTVTCKLDKGTKIGRLDCKNCGQNFSASINHLTQPIDLYTDWIDAADEANKDVEPPQPAKRRRVQDEDDLDEDEEAPSIQRRRQRVDDPDDDEEEEQELPDLPDDI